MADNKHPLIMHDTPADLARAGQLLRAGALVALPTETVYGLAARADSDEAVAAIYNAKGRPDFNPLIVHVADVAGAEALAVLDARAHGLAARFWPGPLTMVLARRDDARLAAAVTAGLATVALRCPAHGVMRAVLGLAGVPLAAPSANRSGGVSPTAAGHVVASLGDRVDAVVDGGACTAGLESTIVALRAGGGWQILRPGPIIEAEIESVLGVPADAVGPGKIEAPGQLTSHYAPGKPVRLYAEAAREGEFLIGFGALAGDFNLSPTGDLAEAAARLYAALHAAANSACPRVAVAAVPDDGIGAAINDRLARAAA